jgi:hypothetical protein
MEIPVTLRQPKLQLFGAWSSLIYCFLFGVGWLFFNGGMFPPHSPSATEAEIVAIFQAHPMRIRLCMVSIMFSAMFMLPFAGTLGSQIARIEGGAGVLTYVAVLSAFANAIFTFYPPIWWLVISYRPERFGAITYFMNDAAWLQFVGALALFVPIVLAQGVAAFIDKSDDKIFPRWSGYFCMWVFFLELPTTLIFFFYDGPFAWNGIIGFWLPAIVFFSYFLVTFYLMVSYIRRQVKAAK